MPRSSARLFTCLAVWKLRRARLDDDDQGVHVSRRPPSEVLQPRLHIDDEILVPLDEDMGEQALEHDVLRAETAAPALGDGAEDHELDAVPDEGKPVGQVVDAGGSA